MRLQVGDTIEGTQAGPGWWSTVRLTLLWLGDTHAVWRETSRTNSRLEWAAPRESAAWTLRFREWRKVSGIGQVSRAPKEAVADAQREADRLRVELATALNALDTLSAAARSRASRSSRQAGRFQNGEDGGP